MSMHTVEFEYVLPEVGDMTLDLDPVLDYAEKEEICLAEIKEIYPDILQVEITKIEVM